MSKLPHKQIMTIVQLFIIASFVGMSLYVYNDWRAHEAHAEPLTQEQPVPSKSAYPLDQGVSGTVQVSPDGNVKQL